jgi:iron complex outermembrane receptor protein
MRRLIDTLRDTEAWGTFVEATYPITDALRVTGGLRYDETKVSVTQALTINQTLATPANFTTPAAGFPEVLVTRTLSGPAGERKFTETTYKARIEYDLTPQNMIYAVTSSAASPGDVTLTADNNNQPIVRELVSQTIKAYEIGSKNRFFDNRLQMNGSVYYNDYGGFQTLQINVNPVPPPVGQQVFDVLTAPVKVVGAELETQFQPTPDDTIGLDLAYTHSYFADRTLPTAYGTTFGTYFARSNVPKAVPFTARLSYDHTFHPFGDSRLRVGGDVGYASEYDIQNIYVAQVATPALEALLVPYVRADEELILNLRASWSFSDGKYSLAGWVRNVADNRYKTTGNVTSVTAANLNTPGQGINGITSSISPPRTWGISVNAKF